MPAGRCAAGALFDGDTNRTGRGPCPRLFVAIATDRATSREFRLTRTVALMDDPARHATAATRHRGGGAERAREDPWMDIDQTDDQLFVDAFDEAWYLGQNRDVAEAVRKGLLGSGLGHYLMHGRAEGRRPLSPDAAIAYSAEMRRRHPGDPAMYAALTAALRDGQRLDEASAVANEAIGLFPGDPGAFIAAAQVARDRQDWPEAIGRWERVRQLFPAELAGYTHGALTLRDAGRPGEAEALLDEAIQRFPDAPEPLIEKAWLSHLAGDWIAAADLWARVRVKAP